MALSSRREIQDVGELGQGPVYWCREALHSANNPTDRDLVYLQHGGRVSLSTDPRMEVIYSKFLSHLTVNVFTSEHRCLEMWA